MIVKRSTLHIWKHITSSNFIFKTWQIMIFECWKFIYWIKNKTLSRHPRPCRRPPAFATTCGCPHGRKRESAQPHGRSLTSRWPADAGGHPCLYNPSPRGHFLLFFFCLLVGDLDFALAMPFRLAKRKGSQAFWRGSLCPWSACVFSSASYFCEDFGALP